MTNDQIDAVSDEILADDVGDSVLDLAGQLLGRSRYTTAALYALGEALRQEGDETGADLIAGYARAFARHEATVI